MGNKNRWMSLLVAMMIVVGLMGVQRVDADEENPPASFQIISVNPSKSPLKKGDSFGLFIGLRGASGVEFDYADFRGVKSIDTGTTTSIVSLPVTASGEEPEQELYIGGLTYLGGDGNISFTIQAQGDAGAQTVNINLKTEEVTDGKGSLQLKDVSQVSLVAGTTQKVDLLIYNSSASTVKNPNINISVADDKSGGITIKDGKAIKVSSISPKSSARITFEIEASKAVKSGNYKLEFNLAGTVETVPLRVTSDLMPPQLQFSIDGQQELIPGDSQNLRIKVENVGDSRAQEIKVELENQEKLAIVGGSNVKYIAKIGAKQSANVNYTINISPTVKQNMLPIKITYTYRDEIGEPNQDKEQYIYIPIKGGLAGSGEVVIENIIAPAGTMGVDRDFNIKFTLASLKGDAKNVQISVSGEDAAGIVPKSQNLFMIPSAKKGSRKQYTVTMAATQKAGSYSHPIKIQVSYDGIGGDEKIEFIQYTSVNVFNPEAEEKDPEAEELESKKGQPKVIVGEYKVSPTIVKAGEEFQLDIGFLNTNRIKPVYNLKANLTVKEQGENDAGNVFTPVNASNTFYIADLSPGQMETKSITMYTIPNANPKTYQVELELEYEDEKGNQITATENIGIPVEQTTKIEIAEVNMDFMTLGMPMPIDVSLYNTGKTNISNLMIYTEGEGFSVQDNKMFVGTFERGASEYYSPTIIPEQAGMLSGTIVVEYEEATGEITQIRKDFEFEVMDMPEEMPGDMGEMPFPGDEKKGKLAMIAGMIAGIAAAVVITVIFLKKRKKKKDFEFDLYE